MTEQQIKQAQEAVNLLDRAASLVSVNREDHVKIQLASQYLRGLLEVEAKHVPSQPPIAVLPDPVKE